MINVHRRHADTVFLTGAHPAGGGFLATADLPAGHAYYAAHTAPENQHLDPMLLLEAARQAVLHVAHAYLDVPDETQFLLVKAALQVFAVPDDGGSRSLSMRFVSLGPRRVRGELRSLTPRLTLALGGVEIGRVGFTTSLATPARYAAVRLKGRDTPPPLSDSRPDPDLRSALAPGLVGRVNDSDVLLADLQTGPDGATARLLVPVRHLGLFDHRLDHVPGSLLVEAARQLMTCLSPSPAQAVMRSLEATFHTFAELDAPVRLHAHPGPRGLVVTVAQGDVRAATVTIR